MSDLTSLWETEVENRPWGNFEAFVKNSTVTVKLITVDPGQRLSLQTHNLRAEMWRVLDGPLDVSVGGRSWTALPGSTVCIGVGEAHRMANSGPQPARVLEIAFGHFDEADIHRIEDDYDRLPSHVETDSHR